MSRGEPETPQQHPVAHALQSLSRSVGRPTTLRTEWFPNLYDYVDAFRRAAIIRDRDDLLQRRPDLLPVIFHDWVRKRQIGCRFAQRLAREPSKFGWIDLVLPHHDSSEHVRWLDEFLATASYDSEAVLLLLPTVTNLSDLSDLVGNLLTSPRWFIHEIVGYDDSEFVPLGLRWHPPGEELASWVLAFGDFPEWPFTRRAPLPALTLRTHSPKPGNEGIDLAAIDPMLPNVEAFDRMMSGTRRLKERLLEAEPDLCDYARARVTFRLPRSLAMELLT